jgi:DNA-binding transcriptional LysR family regulator
MEMQQVRYFVALAETLNFTRAAERCNVSQPSLTRAIKLLEDELGGPLFHRERNNTHLTDLGRQVEPFLRRVQAEAEGARARAAALAKLQTAELRLGIARELPLLPVMDTIERFAQAHPSVDVVLPSAEPDELVEMLRRGDLELIIVPEGAEEPEDFHYYALGEDAPQVVLAEGHRFAQLATISLAELAGETLACVQRCPRWQVVEERLRTGGIAVRPRIVVGRIEWLLDLVRSGLAIGLVSRHLDPGPGLACRPLEDSPPARKVMLSTKRGRLYSPPVRAFVELALAPRRAHPGPAPRPD